MSKHAELKVYDGIPVFGDPDEASVNQIKRCATGPHAVGGALMADHHKGYSQPIGGVVAYENAVSPSGVGYDIACGNKAVLTDMPLKDLRRDLSNLMDRIYSEIEFGVGRANAKPIDHDLFDDPTWDDVPELRGLEWVARRQLGTVGSGNHYVDLFHDEEQRVWIGVHFGSRGFGHAIASGFLALAQGRAFGERVPEGGMDAQPTVLSLDTDVGRAYVKAMELAGRYAYAGRDAVCDHVLRILGANSVEEVHNHHNFAWLEEHDGRLVYVVRKGATPAFPGQRGFVGGSMGDISVILEGVDSEESKQALYSTVHGAGRVMSRTAAAGKKRWKRGKTVRLSDGKISRQMMLDWIKKLGVELRGADTDESPHCYKRLPQVLRAMGPTIKIIHTLQPVGVAMAGADTEDPYKD